MTQTLTSRDPSDPLFQPVRDSDPATPGDPLSRLRFHYGQCLSAEDFETEQRYFVLRQRLHNALLHGVGTVWGLAIRRQQPPPEGGDQLICDPGMAIDPLGREIWVPQSLCLDLTALEARFWEQLQPSPSREPMASAPAKDAANKDAANKDAANSEAPAGEQPNPEKESETEADPKRNPTSSAPDPLAQGGEPDTPGLGPSPSPEARRAYVVLRYEACLTDAVPVIPLPCGDEQDGLAPSRLRDSFRLCLEAEAPPDPCATVRDITRRRRPAEPRQRLLQHALNTPAVPAPLAPLERFWSGADDGALLLATLDLEAKGAATAEGWQPVALLPDSTARSNPDNGVRAVLPAVQALGDLALGIRLEGPSPSLSPFQVLGVTATAVDGQGNPLTSGTAAAMEFDIQLSEPPLVGVDPQKTLAAAVQLLLWEEGPFGWKELTDSTPNKLTARELSDPTDRPAIRLTVAPAWTTPTTFQVVLKGTGPAALMAQSTPPRPLAGLAGEVVPPGSGRDAFLFGTYTPPNP
jgi:hypothetical protein